MQTARGGRLSRASGPGRRDNSSPMIPAAPGVPVKRTRRSSGLLRQVCARRAGQRPETMARGRAWEEDPKLRARGDAEREAYAVARRRFPLTRFKDVKVGQDRNYLAKGLIPR